MRNKILNILPSLVLAILVVFYFKCCQKEKSPVIKNPNHHIDSLVKVIASNNQELYRLRKQQFHLTAKNDSLKKEADKLPRINTFKRKETDVSKQVAATEYDSLYNVAEKKEAISDTSFMIADSLKSLLSESEKKQAVNDSLNLAVQDSLQKENVSLSKENDTLAEENKKLKKGRLRWFAWGFAAGKVETYAEIATLQYLGKGSLR